MTPAHGRGAQGSVTLADVARRAGVSAPTASRILNGQTRFTDATRQRVLEAAQSLGFTPNLAARSLRRGQGDTVAMLVGDIQQRVYAALARHVQHALEELGFDLLLYDLSHSDDRLARILKRAEALQLRGIVLATTERIPPASLDRLQALRRQRVLVTSLWQDLTSAGIPSITQDEAGAGAQAARLLLGLGRRPMAFLGRITGSVVGAERYRGWRQAMAEAGQAVDERLVWDVAYRFGAGYGATSQAVAAGLAFGGLVCSSDEMALGAIAALHDRGLSVPDQVAVVGFGHADWGVFTRPALTTMSDDPQGIAAMVSRQLASAGDGVADAGRVSLLVIPRDVVRGQSA